MNERILNSSESRRVAKTLRSNCEAVSEAQVGRLAPARELSARSDCRCKFAPGEVRVDSETEEA